MGVQQSLLSAFQTATPATTRFLKVLIVDEQATLALTVPPKGTDREDFALIADKGDITETQASYFLWLLDGGKGWLFITYVPDGAKVREKMLYSSSKSRLLKALGEASFTDSLHATTPADLTPRGYKAHLDAAAAPHPLTERERALQEVKQAEYEASKEDAFRGTGGGVRGGAGPLSAVMGVGAGLEWGDGVEEALKELAQEGASSGDKRKLVGLHIDPKATTRLSLASSASVALDDVKASLPADGPQYTVYSYLPPGDSTKPVIIFIYSCPPKSPIRTRMIYSSSVGSLIAKIKERVGIEVDKKIETSEPASLTRSEILSELSAVLSTRQSQPSRAASLPTPAPYLARPSGPAHAASFHHPPPKPSSPAADAPAPAPAPASAGFAKPRGPPRRAGAGAGAGRVAAAKAAFESANASS